MNPLKKAVSPWKSPHLTIKKTQGAAKNSSLIVKLRFVGLIYVFRQSLKSFDQTFSKVCGVERRSLSSPVATGETLYASESAGKLLRKPSPGVFLSAKHHGKQSVV
ncbi:MAG: hypothetical protein IKB13_03945 [Clostridia bacterium]|nr:hypothetical protein [Clostridia bacterium]